MENEKTLWAVAGNKPLITNKAFDLDVANIDSIDDIKEVLKALNIRVNWFQEDCPPEYKEIYKRGFLKEIK